MYRWLFSVAAVGLGLALAWQAARAAGPHHHHPASPPLPPGPGMVEEVIYQDVVRYVCKVVPDVKKRWVYDCVDDPFCIQHSTKARGCGPACGHGCGHHGGNATCPNCEGPFCRKQLVKRLIEEECGTKCVVEKIVEKVPVKACRPASCPGGLTPTGPLPAVEQLRSSPTPVAPPKQGL